MSNRRTPKNASRITMKLQRSPMTFKARVTELGRPRSRTSGSDVRLFRFASRIGVEPAPGPSRQVTAFACTSALQWEQATIARHVHPHVLCTRWRGGFAEPASHLSPKLNSDSRTG